MAQPTLLLTRPAAQSQEFAERCRAALGPDLAVVISPVLSIRPRDSAPDLGSFRGVVLTSANGARALAAQADVCGVRAWCVGDRTAEAARRLGMDARSAAGSADELVDMVAGEPGPLLHAHGAESRGRVAERLTAAGTETREAVLYDQVAQPLSAEARRLLDGDGPVILPLFSPRSAALVAAAAGGARAPLCLASLSAAVDAAWTGPAPAARRIAERPDAAALVRCVTALFRGELP